MWKHYFQQLNEPHIWYYFFQEIPPSVALPSTHYLKLLDYFLHQALHLPLIFFFLWNVLLSLNFKDQFLWEISDPLSIVFPLCSPNVFFCPSLWQDDNVRTNKSSPPLLLQVHYSIITTCKPALKFILISLLFRLWHI